ncbi:hypothetical protein N0V90_000777 [Kalmusia sp. IMI 367209]|nr:hypothetical protein N0V90_000777 [Kalmusia sp. IMI 367209]
MRPSQLLAAVVALSSVTAASSDVFDSINALGDVKHMFFPRQDGEDASTTAKKASTTEAPKETDKSSATEKPTATKSDAKTSDKGESSGKASKTTSKPKVTNFGPDVQAGGVQMVTPNPILGPQYYKVGEWITFAWNYTSLSVTPSAVDIMASCSVNQQTYTIAVNQSVQATGKVLWDTGAYKSEHPNGPDFVTETYTLLIYDAESSVSATAKPGYLTPFNQFYFGIYEPQPYVEWKDFKCANCNPNGALSAFEKSTLKVLAITSVTTIASLLYFAASFGVW